MKVRACLRCGFCCMQAPCGFGERLESSSQCAFLSFDKDGLASCDKFEEISKDPSSRFSPAFGQGSCSPMNTYRDEIKIKFYDGVEQYVEIDDF